MFCTVQAAPTGVVFVFSPGFNVLGGGGGGGAAAAGGGGGGGGGERSGIG